jgi:hypothetical protein
MQRLAFLCGSSAACAEPNAPIYSAFFCNRIFDPNILPEIFQLMADDDPDPAPLSGDDEKEVLVIPRGSESDSDGEQSLQRFLLEQPGYNSDSDPDYLDAPTYHAVRVRANQDDVRQRRSVQRALAVGRAAEIQLTLGGGARTAS